MRKVLRRACLLLMLLTLYFAAFTTVSSGQSVVISTNASDFIGITVNLNYEGIFGTILNKGTELTFYNSTGLPFNYSLEAFNSHFNNARFTVTEQGDFLRVSYNTTSDVNQAEAYSNEVLGEFRNAFNLSISVMNQTYVNTDYDSIDVYYMLSIGGNAKPFEEVVKYRPSDGFGQFVDEDLLNHYIPGSSTTGLLFLEYTLTRLDQATLGWTSDFAFTEGTIYENQSQINVSLKELLNHTGPITPSPQRTSRVVIYAGKKEITDRSPLLLSLNNSTPAYTSLKEEADYNVITYNLTQPVDDVAVKIDFTPEPPSSFSLTNAVIIISVVCVVLALVLVFVKRRKLKRG